MRCFQNSGFFSPSAFVTLLFCRQPWWRYTNASPIPNSLYLRSLSNQMTWFREAFDSFPSSLSSLPSPGCGAVSLNVPSTTGEGDSGAGPGMSSRARSCVITPHAIVACLQLGLNFLFTPNPPSPDCPLPPSPPPRARLRSRLGRPRHIAAALSFQVTPADMTTAEIFLRKSEQRFREVSWRAPTSGLWPGAPVDRRRSRRHRKGATVCPPLYACPDHTVREEEALTWVLGDDLLNCRRCSPLHKFE